MTGIAHALIGAAVGAVSKNPWSAFIYGIISHGAADAAPHRDLPPIVEVPLLAAALYAIGKRYGFDSKQFTGALGGILPDAEHGLMIAGIIKPEDEIYPTQCSAPGSLTIWLLAVIPPALALGFAGFLWGAKVWDMDTIGLNTTPWVGVLVLMNLLTTVLIAVIALVSTLADSSESHSFSESFITRLQRASVIGAKALLVVYCVAMIACVSVTARANGQIDRLTDNEVKMMLDSGINGS